METIEAGARFLEEFDKKVPVRAAFWIRVDEDDVGYLYVSSDQFIGTSVGAAYAEVLRIARDMPDPNFDPFRVKLIKPDDPLARAAIEILRRFPAKVPTRLRGRNFGGLDPEEVYIYPNPVTVA
jgi:hypothetical protein